MCADVPPTERKGYRILLVDDDLHLLRLIGDFLLADGFAVRAAASAEEGLRLCAQELPDLVVLDLSMPGMGGLGFLRRMRQQDQATRVPVLIHTARANMEDRFGNLEIAGYVPKPCSGGELARRIRSILTKRRKDQEGARKHVLLIEDEVGQARKFTEALTAAGYAVSTATNGLELLRTAVNTAPDAILIKERMPDARGEQLVAVLRGHRATATIPLLMYAVVDAGGAATAKASPPGNVGAYVPAPDPTSLLAALHTLLAPR